MIRWFEAGGLLESVQIQCDIDLMENPPRQPQPGNAVNPYIAGKALNQDRGFVGREDVFTAVEEVLRTPDQNSIVLFGQRRIGKTSILRQLMRRLPTTSYLPIYFDLQHRARKTLGQVFHELASTIAEAAGLRSPTHDSSDEEGRSFRAEILPALYRTLGPRRPVLLFDEFDVLDTTAEQNLSGNVASHAFFPALRQLMEAEPHLGFVFVIGRKAEDLSIDVKATFKDSRYKRVSVLDEHTARTLITTAERQGTLRFTPGAIDLIINLTSGHPYFTQLMCQILWDRAHTLPIVAPLVDERMVENAVSGTLEAGENVFEWIWDGLPAAERVIFAAIAGSVEERSYVTKDDLLEILQRHGLRILTGELNLAPDTLVKWEMLRKTDVRYSFFVELLRRWVAERKPLSKVKDELDRVDFHADALYRAAEGYLRQPNRDLESAQDRLRDALRINPNHMKARLRLGEVLREQGKLDEALRELEELYRRTPDQAHYPLIQVLLTQGEELERAGQTQEALGLYERVLTLSPGERMARERFATIWSAIGATAQKEGNLEQALHAYEKAGAHEQIASLQAEQRRQRLELRAAEALDSEKREDWVKACEILNELKYEDPENERWAKELERVVSKKEFARSYGIARAALEQQEWEQAIDSLRELVFVQPEYKDAAQMLALAVRRGFKPAELASAAAPKSRAGEEKRDNQTLSCSFCGKSKVNVKHLIAGPGVSICDDCIGLCNDLIAETIDREESRGTKGSGSHPKQPQGSQRVTSRGTGGSNLQALEIAAAAQYENHPPRNWSEADAPWRAQLPKVNLRAGLGILGATTATASSASLLSSELPPRPKQSNSEAEAREQIISERSASRPRSRIGHVLARTFVTLILCGAVSASGAIFLVPRTIPGSAPYGVAQALVGLSGLLLAGAYIGLGAIPNPKSESLDIFENDAGEWYSGLIGFYLIMTVPVAAVTCVLSSGLSLISFYAAGIGYVLPIAILNLVAGLLCMVSWGEVRTLLWGSA